MNILVTGAAGFIGSNFIHYYLNQHPSDHLVVLDKLTYAGRLENLSSVLDQITFEKGDICDTDLVEQIFQEHQITGVVHFAAESHVDNSIANPFIFTKTNVLGTHTLLEVARKTWGENSPNKFVHISTDEVFGTLGDTGYFSEQSQIQPNSPYSASKASSDLLARAYSKTYKMNINITNCSNNYGPYQHPEKLIPKTIKLALEGKKIPVYGTGNNIRDWLFVDDHCKAIDLVFHHAPAGQRYCIGGHNEKSNIEIVQLILTELGKSTDLIEYVADRKGHDFRYAINPAKIHHDLGWTPDTAFEQGIKATIAWYKKNPEIIGL